MRFTLNGQCSIQNGGKVQSSRSYAIYGTSTSTVFVEYGGIVRGEKERGYGIYCMGTLYIKGGEITANGAAVVSASSDSMVSMSGGTVTGTYAGVYAMEVCNTGYISGGTVTHSTGYYALCIQQGATCSITGGNIGRVYDYNS